jgi:hypothetical protein
VSSPELLDTVDSEPTRRRLPRQLVRALIGAGILTVGLIAVPQLLHPQSQRQHVRPHPVATAEAATPPRRFLSPDELPIPAVVVTTSDGRYLLLDGDGTREVDANTARAVAPPAETANPPGLFAYPTGWSPVDRAVWVTSAGVVAFASRTGGETAPGVNGGIGSTALVAAGGPQKASLIEGSLGALPDMGVSIRGGAVLFAVGDPVSDAVRLTVWRPGAAAIRTDRFLPASSTLR